MQAKLVIVKGESSKGEVKVKPPTVIGRSREASLTIAHPLISRRHCELFENDGLLMVRDLGSLNGTFIGDDRIAEAPLPPQSRFSVGPLTFRVEYDYQGDLDSLPPVKLAPAEAEGEKAAAAKGHGATADDNTEYNVRRPLKKAKEEPVADADSTESEVPFSEMADVDEGADANEEDTMFSLADEVETEPVKPLKKAPEHAPASTKKTTHAQPEKKGWFGMGKKEKKEDKAEEAKPAASAKKPAPAKHTAPAKKPAPAKPSPTKKKASDDDLAFEALQEGGEGKSGGGDDDGSLDDFFKSLE